MKFSFLFLLIAISTVGCTNKDVYEHLQRENKRNCEELPATQYDECVADSKRSYNEYDKERKKL